MPQMMPLNWMLLFISIMLIMATMFINFSFMMKMVPEKSMFKIKDKPNFNMLW